MKSIKPASESTDEEDNLVTVEVLKGRCCVQTQTSKNHFDRITQTKAFKRKQIEKAWSTDYSHSVLFEARKGLHKSCQTEDDLEQIPTEILSQLECEYHCSSLKKKVLEGENTLTQGHIFRKALNT